MRIKEITLKNFRNYENETIKFQEGLNVVIGKNAMGKTNLLESIYCCAIGKSPKTTKYKDLIRMGQQAANIRIVLQKKYRDHVINASAGGLAIKAPGFVFNDYIDEQVKQDFLNRESAEILHSDLYLDELCGISNVRKINMRSKEDGWKNFKFSIEYNKNGNIINYSLCHRVNIYMRAFLDNMILRPSCYSCKAKNCRSNSDITMADYWGIRILHPEMDDDRGTSFVLLHNQKGLDALPLNKCRYMETIYDII